MFKVLWLKFNDDGNDDVNVNENFNVNYHELYVNLFITKTGKTFKTFF